MNTQKPLILQINAGISRGGAASIAINLYKRLKRYNYASKLATGGPIPKNSPYLFIPKNTYQPATNKWEQIFFYLGKKAHKKIGFIKGAGKLASALYNLGKPSCLLKNLRGVENFENYPGTKDFFNNLKPFPDIIHGHNLHGRYFDLSCLPKLSNKTPFVLTLHDEWMFTGHCACTLKCQKWQAGCGKCPNLSIYDPLWRDTTAFNWKQKQAIYKKSKLYIVTPSQWLMDKVDKSILSLAIIKKKIIHNGVDSTIFKPGNKNEARQKLNLPLNATIILFIANQAKTNPFKDYKTLEKAMSSLSEKNTNSKKILLLCVGEKSPSIKKNNLEIKFVEYTQNIKKLVNFYNCGDLFIHATKADNFPTTILEAMACGLPVIATNVGGIPEQVSEPSRSNYPTGLLYTQGNHIELANKITLLLRKKETRRQMGINARNAAKINFNLKKQVSKYHRLYQYILSRSNVKNQIFL